MGGHTLGGCDAYSTGLGWPGESTALCSPGQDRQPGWLGSSGRVLSPGLFCNHVRSLHARSACAASASAGRWVAARRPLAPQQLQGALGARVRLRQRAAAAGRTEKIRCASRQVIPDECAQMQHSLQQLLRLVRLRVAAQARALARPTLPGSCGTALSVCRATALSCTRALFGLLAQE